MDQQQQVEPIRVRIISIGDVCSGKSGLIKRYCNPGRFVSQHIPTIGLDYGIKTTSKTMNDNSSTNIKVDFFDLSGDAAYSEVRNEFYNNIDGVLLVFDVTSRQSFESLDSWIKELRKYGISSENTILVLVGNKADKYPREVKEQEVSYRMLC
jgi:DnaJ homolog subfamily C member 27